MLNEEKVKIMTELAMYEEGEGKKYLPVSRYYRSDYIGCLLYTSRGRLRRGFPGTD